MKTVIFAVLAIGMLANSGCAGCDGAAAPEAPTYTPVVPSVSPSPVKTDYPELPGGDPTYPTTPDDAGVTTTTTTDTPDMATATPVCGENGQPCCPDYACGGGLACMGTGNCAPPAVCGEVNQICCESGCHDSALICDDDVCQVPEAGCGTQDLPCCITQTACRGGLVCVAEVCDVSPSPSPTPSPSPSVSPGPCDDHDDNGNCDWGQSHKKDKHGKKCKKNEYDGSGKGNGHYKDVVCDL